MVRYLRALLLGLLLQIVPGVPINGARAATSQFLALFLGYSKAVNAVALSPDGRQALSGGRDNYLRLWDIKTGLLLRTFDAETNSINAVAFSPDGRQILMGSNEKQLLLWDLATGQTIKAMEGYTGAVQSVAFSPDGRQALSGGGDNIVRLWDLNAGQLLKSFEGHLGEVLSVSFSPDGQNALSASKDKTLRLWDVKTGEFIRTFDGHGDAVTSAMFSGDGGKVLSASADKTVKLWDAATGQIIQTFEGHSDEVLSAAFTRDGHHILSGSKDMTLKLWNAKGGALIKTFEGHSGAVTSAVLSGDGELALSGSSDKTLKLWDMETKQLRGTIDLQSVTFSPGGYRSFFSGAAASKAADPGALDARLQDKGLKRGNAVFVRIFKADLQVELWMRKAQHFELFATYPICAWSGQIGPKLREGDNQSPEGFYTIGKSQLNPNSHYHRSFNLGYPNSFDRAYGRTGANLMMHGGCGSAGCYAMTDALIDELWLIVTAALNSGQEHIWVHVFPFRMTGERLAAFDWHPSAPFWRDMKPAYDLFEETRLPPQIAVCNKRYSVQRPHAGGTDAQGLQLGCPVSRESSWRPRPGMQ